ncbi:MAG: SigB/SigF/SigG family RNA polymerase sigma factor [Bacilli bacterium]|nr:SigB/SigF/SigG family RNA polymerase sigma factor [Bacilli bacterium]
MDQKLFKELLLKARSGDESAKTKIINENIPLVWSLVHRFKNTLYDKEDLFQIGCLALLKAIDKFNLDYDVQFSTYAVPIILGELKRHFRDDGAIKVSRSLKELNIRINKAKNELYYTLGREPTIEELSSYLNENCEEIVMAIEANYYPTSLNEVVYEKDGSTINMEDRIIDDQSEKFKNILSLKEELKKLTSDEKQLIYLRYYLDLNQKTIAERFNVSQVQISRMEKKIIEKIRKQFV